MLMKINILRNRVEMDDIDYTGMPFDVFREQILMERAVELYMEGLGFLILQDLVIMMNM